MAMMPDMTVSIEFQAVREPSSSDIPQRYFTLIEFQRIRSQIQVIQQRVGKSFENQSRTGATVFHEILQGDLPDKEKDTLRLTQEGQSIIGAGTETTAWSI